MQFPVCCVHQQLGDTLAYVRCSLSKLFINSICVNTFNLIQSKHYGDGCGSSVGPLSRRIAPLRGYAALGSGSKKLILGRGASPISSGWPEKREYYQSKTMPPTITPSSCGTRQQSREKRERQHCRLESRTLAESRFARFVSFMGVMKKN